MIGKTQEFLVKQEAAATKRIEEIQQSILAQISSLDQEATKLVEARAAEVETLNAQIKEAEAALEKAQQFLKVDTFQKDLEFARKQVPVVQDKISVQTSVYDDSKQDYEKKLNELNKLKQSIAEIKNGLIADGQPAELNSDQQKLIEQITTKQLNIIDL